MSIQFSHCLLGANSCKLWEIYDLQKLLDQYREFLATQLVIKMKKSIKDCYPQGEIEVVLYSFIILTSTRSLYLVPLHFFNSLLSFTSLLYTLSNFFLMFIDESFVTGSSSVEIKTRPACIIYKS